MMLLLVTTICSSSNSYIINIPHDPLTSEYWFWHVLHVKTDSPQEPLVQPSLNTHSSQVPPLQGPRHWQSNPPLLFTQVPPFLHISMPSSHSSISSPQSLPVYPGTHVHSKPFIMFLHVPPFMHGASLHSLISVSQLLPVKPAVHWHV